MNKSKIKFKEILPLIILLVLTALVIIAIATRDREGSRSRIIYGYFDTVTVITDYGVDGSERINELALLVEEELGRYHRLFDIYNSYSNLVNLKDINERAGAGATKVDRELFDFLVYCKEVYTLTGGEVNVCMGSVLKVWHDFRSKYLPGTSVPPKELLSERMEHCNIDCLILDEENMTVELTDPQMSLDVGAVGKGYAAKKTVEKLESLGISSVTLDVGGNLCLVGTKPSGDGWITGIENPDRSDDERYVMTFEASDTSVVTSGDYQRYVEIDGKKYHHIIDKDTLYPSEYFTSVTVVTDDSGLADALSTALFSMSYEEGYSLVSSIQELTLVVWVTGMGEVLTFGYE